MIQTDISTDEIWHDIIATQQEIVAMTKEAEHLENTPITLPHARWDHMRASARRTGIKEREDFITELEEVLRSRGEEV